MRVLVDMDKSITYLHIKRELVFPSKNHKTIAFIHKIIIYNHKLIVLSISIAGYYDGHRY